MLWDFGPFRLDLVQAGLWQAERRVPLRPKTLALLAYLVTHAGQVVTKVALMDALWPETKVGEGVLTTSMGELRKALGETAQAPQYIATVHGWGYRFIAPVTLVEPARPLEAPAAGAPPRASAPVSAPLCVAREAELALLHAWYAKALQGERQVGCITGEAGIGKTTLVDAFVAQLAGQAALWRAQGQCIEHYGAGEAYLPLLEALGQLGRTPDGPHLVTLLRQQAPSWLLQLPGLLAPGEAEALQRATGGATRERMLRELTEAVEGLTAVRPLLLVLEDLHWSDTATIEWLAYVARRREPARLLVLGTYRPVDAMVRAHPVRAMMQELMVHGRGAELSLGEWAEAGVAAYLAHRGAGAGVPAALARVLTARTEGHPLFLVTVVDELVRQERLRVGPAGWELGEGLEAGTVEVPQSIRYLLEHQVAQLCPAAQALLAAASVAGVEFAAAAVAAAVQQTEEDVEAQCEALAHQHHLLQSRGTAVWPDGTVTARYGFRHALYQELLYERVPVRRRARWHQQMGTRLEAGYGAQAGEIAAALAEHFVRGQAPRRAVAYLRQAGDNARARSAYREAVAYYEHARAALAQLPASQDTHAQVIDLSLALRTVLWTLGELGRLFVTLQEAARLAEALGDHRRLGWALVYLLAHFAQVGEPERALAAGQRALAIATTLGERGLTVAAQHYLGGVYRSLGDYRRAIECFQTNVAGLDGALLQEYLGLPGLAAVFARSHLVIALAECGAFAEGWGPAEEGVQLAEAAHHPYSQVMAGWAVGFLTLRQGAIPQAILVLERALALVQEADLQLLVPMVAAPLGAAYTCAGRAADAVPLLEQAVAQASARQYLWDHALRVGWLDEAYLRAGQLAAAELQAQRALEFSQTHQERGHAAYALWLLGAVATQRHPLETAPAAAYYQQALALAAALGMRPLQAHCHCGLGTLYAQAGQAEQARGELSTAREMYRAMAMTFWLPQREAARNQPPQHGHTGSMRKRLSDSNFHAGVHTIFLQMLSLTYSLNL